MGITKLTPQEDFHIIRQLRREGHTCKEIAQVYENRYGIKISHITISNFCSKNNIAAHKKVAK